jgi:cytidylate kinase
MIIAIDGPAASGKGTLARNLARHFDLPHLDTGLLYRATARALVNEGRDVSCKEAAIAAARGLALPGFDDISLRGRRLSPLSPRSARPSSNSSAPSRGGPAAPSSTAATSAP